ncbi:T9SS type A sorting domain-containing protein, partial [Phaeodactylibacter sp.]
PSLVVPHDGPEVAADHETLARIFPNPSSGQFTVELGQPTPFPITVSLRNTMGQLIEQRQFEPGAQQLPWQTQNLPNGLYFLEIPKSDGTTQTLKWMKQ